MNVILKPELEELVNEKIQSGEYPSPEAVLEDALQLLRERDALDRRETREAVERALEQSRRGEGRPAEEVFGEMRARYGIPR